MRIGNNSRRPASILNMKVHLLNTLKPLKFEEGPTPERPGPILFMVASEAVKLVVKSLFSKEIIKTEVTSIEINVTRYTFVERTTSCSIGLSSIFIFLILFGWIYEFNSFICVFIRTRILDNLMPPPVLPAHAPTNIKIIIMNCEVAGQSPKSVVAKPVDDDIEATVKEACVKASKALEKLLYILIKIINIVAMIINRKRLTSSMENAFLNCLNKRK